MRDFIFSFLLFIMLNLYTVSQYYLQSIHLKKILPEKEIILHLMEGSFLFLKKQGQRV